METIDPKSEVDASLSRKKASIEEMLREHGVSTGGKKIRQLMELDDITLGTYMLGLQIGKCCQEMNIFRGWELYQNAKNNGIYPNGQTFVHLLSLLCGLGELGSGSNQKRLGTSPSNFEAAFSVYGDMMERKVKLTENAYSSLIRCCCTNDRLVEALRLYYEMQKESAGSLTPKLRTVSSLLIAFGDAREVANAFTVYNDATENHNIQLTEREYCAMLKLCVSFGDLRFYSLLFAMTEDLQWLESKETVRVISKWFLSHAPTSHSYCVQTSAVSEFTGELLSANKERLQSTDLTESVRAELLYQLDSFAVVRDPSKVPKANNKVKKLIECRNSKKVVPGVTLLAPPVTSASVSLDSEVLPIAETKKRQICVDNASSVTENLNSGVELEEVQPLMKKKKEKKEEVDEAARVRVWTEYKYWLDENAFVPETCSKDAKNVEKGFNIIVDGANVGYFKQNFAGAPLHVDHNQIEKMICHLEAMHYRPMVFLHSRHLNTSMLPNSTAEKLIQGWKDRGVLYTTPKGFNDDWFWIYAAVKYYCKVVTNDEMRDHHFQLLSPRWFPRWKERNQVHFSFDFPAHVNHSDRETMNPQNNKNTGRENPFNNRVVTLFEPSVYSYKIQHILSPQFEGYYIPPLRPAAITDKGLGGGGTHAFVGSDRGESADLAVPCHEETDMNPSSDRTMNRKSDALAHEEKNDQWTCIYRKIPEINATLSAQSAEPVIRDAQSSGSRNDVTTGVPFTVILVMGVAGCGKTTVGFKMAEVLGFVFADADSYHSSKNISYMSIGKPLTDADRQDWLNCLSKVLEGVYGSKEGYKGVVLACSALKEKYRETILGPVASQKMKVSGNLPQRPIRVVVVHLTGSREIIHQRLLARNAHFMPTLLLDSQFESLESPATSFQIKGGTLVSVLSIDTSADVHSIVQNVVRQVLLK